MHLAKGEFGGRVGIWQLIELFDAHGTGPASCISKRFTPPCAAATN